VQHRLSSLGNNCTRSIVVAKLLQVESVLFRTSTHLKPATEERKEEVWCHDNFSVSQLYHLWTWMCCRLRTLLRHGNSEALTSHPPTRRETPTYRGVVGLKSWKRYRKLQFLDKQLKIFDSVISSINSKNVYFGFSYCMCRK